MDSGHHKVSENIWLCGLKCHIVEIWRDVTFVDRRRTTDGNVNIGLESAKQDSQLLTSMGALYLTMCHCWWSSSHFCPQDVIFSTIW